MKTNLILACLALFGAFLCASTVTAATITTAGSGNWNSTTANAPWPGGTPPSSGDDVVIRAGDAVIVTADATINSITFNNASASAANLSVDSGVTLNVTATIVLQNSATLATAATLQGLGTINCNSVTVGGTTAVTGGDNLVAALTNTIATLSIAGNLSVVATDNGTTIDRFATFSLNSGSVSVGGSVALSAAGGCTALFTMASGPQTGTLTVSGSSPVTTAGAGTCTFTPFGTGTTVVYDGTDQTVPVGSTTTDYRVLTLSGSGTKTLAATMAVGTTCTVNSGVTLNCGTVALGGAGAFTLNSGATLRVGHANGINGNITMSGTKTFSGGANYTYEGTAAQITGTSLPSTLTGTLTIANGTGTGVTLSQSTTVNSPGVCVVNSGALLTMGGAIVLSGSGTFTLSAGGGLAIASTVGITSTGATGNIQTATRNFSTGANYIYNGSAAQVPGNGLPATVNGLTLANATGLTLSGSVTVNGTLTLSSGVLSGAANITLGNGALVARAAGSLTGTPNFGSSVDVSYSANATTGAEIPASPTVLNNLSISGGTITLNKALRVNGSLTMTGGTLDTTLANSYAITVVGNLAVGAGTLTARGSTITVGGDFSGTGTFTAGTSTFVFDGTGSQSIPTAASFGGFYNLTINKSSGTATCVGTLTVGGALNIVQGVLSAGVDDITVTGATSVSGSLRITSTTGAKTFTGNVTINSGGTWNETAAEAFTFAGNLQNDGAFTASTGVHTFSGASKTFSGANAIVIPSLTLNGSYQNNGVLTITSTSAGTGTLTQGVGSTLIFGAAAVSPTLVATASGNTVDYNAGGNQTVKANAYYNLALSGSGNKTLATAQTITGNVDISGTAKLSLTAGTSSANSLSFAGAPQATGTWSAAGSPNHLDTTHFAGAGILSIANIAPVATSPTVTRDKGLSLKVPISALGTDGNGGTLSVSALGAGSQSATISYNSAYVFYLPASGNNNNDSFTYTIIDGQGGTASGTVTVTVTGTAGGASGSISVSGGVATVTLYGIPGVQYDVQRSTDLSNWTTLDATPLNPDPPLTAAADGAVSFTDDFSPGSPPVSAYYRIVAH